MANFKIFCRIAAKVVLVGLFVVALVRIICI